MSKILIRTGLTPFDELDITDVIANNLIGGNSGNLIYANSLFRSLMIDRETEIVPDRYMQNEFSALQINEEYDRYVIALADMFRKGASFEINRMKALIKALKIPCTIVGVGLRANSLKEIDEGFTFDNNVRSFVSAVLDKSAMIGIRGELTGKYLTKLGFKEDRDFMVIGCPSMFTYGGELKRKEININKDSFISVNSSILSPQSAINFCCKILDEYENSVFIPQRIDELKTLYLGCDYIHETVRKNYPDKATDKIYTDGRVKMFLQANQWINYLSGADLSIGARLHGNVAAILAGTPTVIMPHGLRMKEIIEYHGLPHIYPDKLKTCKTLEDVLEKVDFDLMFKKHAENFERYKTFLKANSIETIYDKDYVPYDDMIKEVKGDYSVPSMLNLTPYELANRFDEVYVRKHMDSGARYRVMYKYAAALNNTRITTDIRMLGKKATDKIKHQKRSNTARYQEIKAARAAKNAVEEPLEANQTNENNNE